MVIHGQIGGKKGKANVQPKKAPMKAMKAPASKASASAKAKAALKPKNDAAPKTQNATAAQAAQKKLSQNVKRAKEKAAKPNASDEDKRKAKAAEEAESKYKSLSTGEKASFAIELATYGIQPGKMKWMASYGKESTKGEHNADKIKDGFMTRYLYSKHSGN